MPLVTTFLGGSVPAMPLSCVIGPITGNLSDHFAASTGEEGVLTLTPGTWVVNATTIFYDATSNIYTPFFNVAAGVLSDGWETIEVSPLTNCVSKTAIIKVGTTTTVYINTGEGGVYSDPFYIATATQIQ